MAVENWNTNHVMNNSLEGIDVSEGSLPKDLNDVIRRIAASVRIFYDKAYRKNENVRIIASGDPIPGGLAENDIVIEYIP